MLTIFVVSLTIKYSTGHQYSVMVMGDKQCFSIISFHFNLIVVLVLADTNILVLLVLTMTNP